MLLGRNGIANRVGGRAKGDRMRWVIRLGSRQSSEFADRDVAAMIEFGALRSAINWYRAIL
jgi:hypothetical protein